MARIEFGMSIPKQKIVRTLIVERDRAIQETNEALAELAQVLSADLTVPAGGRWMFWSDEAGKITLVYDTPDAEHPAMPPPLPDSFIPGPDQAAETPVTAGPGGPRRRRSAPGAPPA